MGKEKRIKTTKADFELFKKECKKWIDYYGLYGWDVKYECCELGKEYGRMESDIHARNATIFLDNSIPKFEYSKEEIKKTAFHEVCELLLCRIVCINQSRYVSADEMDEEIHNIIRILENKVFKRKN